MSITPNENEQFNAIVSDFEVSDTSAVKQMEKHDKAAEMTFIPLPNLTRIGFVVDNIAIALFYLFAAITMVAGLSKDIQTATLFASFTLLTLAASWFIPGSQERERIRHAQRNK